MDWNIEVDICDKPGLSEVVRKLGVGGCIIGVDGGWDDSIAITDGLEGVAFKVLKQHLEILLLLLDVMLTTHRLHRKRIYSSPGFDAFYRVFFLMHWM